jgi:hypothetical protein
LTNTALSGARLYWEYSGNRHVNVKGVSIPVAVSVFPDELYPAPRRLRRTGSLVRGKSSGGLLDFPHRNIAVGRKHGALKAVLATAQSGSRA